MNSYPTLIATATPPREQGTSGRLPVLTLIVAGAAAVLSVFAIATDDVAAPAGTSVAVQQSAAPGPAAPIAPAATVSIHRNVDGCGRPIVPGRAACW